MSVINRVTTWASQILTSSSLNGEFNNVVNTLNNLDSATSSWTNVKVGALTSTSSTVLKGSATNDSAAAGNVGEYVSSSGLAANPGGSSAWTNVLTISLTAGDWDVSGNAHYPFPAGGISTGQLAIALSAYASTTTTDHVAGDNVSSSLPPNATNTDVSLCVPAWRVSLSTTTTIYLKTLLTAGAGQWKIDARISARRVR